VEVNVDGSECFLSLEKRALSRFLPRRSPTNSRLASHRDVSLYVGDWIAKSNENQAPQHRTMRPLSRFVPCNC